jgi:hypothetical protein
MKSMSRDVERGLFAILDDLGEELKKKEDEVDQSRKKVVQAQTAVRCAEQYARYAAYALGVIDREIDLVVGLYNRNRLESLSLRLDQLRRDHGSASQRSTLAEYAVWDRRRDFYYSQLSLAGSYGELKQMSAHQQKLFVLLQLRIDKNARILVPSPA